jgi:hypothetical protein
MVMSVLLLIAGGVPQVQLALEEKHGLPGMYYGSMDAADFDGDGRIDLVLSGNFDTVFDSQYHKDADNARLSDRVRVYENVSKKGQAIRFVLKEERKDIFGSRGSLVRVGDFDGDKKPDFAVQMRNGDDIAAYLNRGGFKFEKSILQKGFANNSNSLGMAAIDVERDGTDDLVFISNGGLPDAGLWYRFDRKKKSWVAMQRDFSHGITYGGTIAAGDLDGDGFPEIAIGGNAKEPFGTHRCDNLMFGQTHKNKGGIFEKAPMLIVGSDRLDVCEGMDNAGMLIADLDLDRKNDLIVAGSATAFNGVSGKNGQQYDFAVMFNRGDGKSFDVWQHTGVQDSDGTSNGGAGNVDFPNIAAGDLNGDKRPEVFIQGHRRDYLVRYDVDNNGVDKDNPYVFDNFLFVNEGRSFSTYPLEKHLPKISAQGLSRSLKFLANRPAFVGEGGQVIADFNSDGKNDLVFSGAELPFHTNGANFRDENTVRTIKTYVLRNTR